MVCKVKEKTDIQTCIITDGGAKCPTTGSISVRVLGNKSQIDFRTALKTLILAMQCYLWRGSCFWSPEQLLNYDRKTISDVVVKLKIDGQWL